MSENLLLYANEPVILHCIKIQLINKMYWVKLICTARGSFLFHNSASQDILYGAHKEIWGDFFFVFCVTTQYVLHSLAKAFNYCCAFRFINKFTSSP